MEQYVSNDEARELQDILRTLTPSGTALKTSARELVESWEKQRKPSPRLTEQTVKEIEANFENVREAFRLLGLINAEFLTDPTSVQCFDLRIVERVRICVEARKQFEKSHPR